MVIKRIGPVSCAKISGLLYAVVGLVVGAFFSLAALAGSVASDTAGAGFAAILGVGAIIAFPILYGCLGFVSTLVGAAIYNVAAGAVGGIEMDVQ